MQAGLGLRRGGPDGQAVGLAAESVGPLPSLSTNYLWLKTNSQLHVVLAGPTDNQVAYGPVTTAGDLVPYNGSNFVRFAAGANGQCLTAQSGQASGLQWAACTGSALGNWSFSGNNATITSGSVITSIISQNASTAVTTFSLEDAND